MYVYIIVFDEMKKVEYFVKLTVTKCIFVVVFVMTGCDIIIFTIYYITHFRDLYACVVLPVHCWEALDPDVLHFQSLHYHGLGVTRSG